jgi:hypothetical protein
MGHFLVPNDIDIEIVTIRIGIVWEGCRVLLYENWHSYYIYICNRMCNVE